MAYLPPLIGKKNRRCTRCGLLCGASDPLCDHCYSLNDHELAHLLRRVEREHRSHLVIGLIFLLFAVLIVISLVI